jgi:hypothetical protein
MVKSSNIVTRETARSRLAIRMSTGVSQDSKAVAATILCWRKMMEELKKKYGDYTERLESLRGYL